ncbi:MAG: YjbH domain-containing protein [Tannerellaceae bacterium]
MYKNKRYYTCILACRRAGLLFGAAALLFNANVASAQEAAYLIPGASMWGTTGLVSLVTPEIRNDAMFTLGGTYLPAGFFKESPNWFRRINSGNYFLNLSALPFLEIQYRFTLMKMDNDKWNQDRALSAKFKLVTEREGWRPSVAVGMEDVVVAKLEPKNDFFTRAYVAVSKHVQTGAGMCGGYVTLAYARGNRFVPQAGVSYVPSCAKQLMLMAEYDGKGANAGARLMLWKHVTLMAATYHFNSVTAGLSFSVSLKKQRKESQ